MTSRKSPPSCHITMSIVQRFRLSGQLSGLIQSSGSGAVRGAWYAAPDNSTRSDLERDYAAKFGARPPPLADLAFDAASVAKVIVGPAEERRGNPHAARRICRNRWLVCPAAGRSSTARVGGIPS